MKDFWDNTNPTAPSLPTREEMDMMKRAAFGHWDAACILCAAGYRRIHTQHGPMHETQNGPVMCGGIYRGAVKS